MATHSSILAWRIPMDRGAWRATAHGVTKSQTRLSDFTFTLDFPIEFLVSLVAQIVKSLPAMWDTWV